jgi:hypothetical protein
MRIFVAVVCLILGAGLDSGLARASEPGIAGERGFWLSQAEAAEDIRYGIARAEAIHPNLYDGADRAHVISLEQRIIEALPNPSATMDIYLALAEIFGQIHDPHFLVMRPASPDGGDLAGADWNAGGADLWVSVMPRGDHLMLLSSRTPGLKAGDVLTTINGKSAIELFTRAAALEPGTPERQALSAGRAFGSLIWDLGIRGPFVVSGTFAGQQGTITVAGATLDSVLPSAAAPIDYGIRLQEIRDRIAFVVFNDYVSRDSFDARLELIFDEISDQNALGLIVDLRENSMKFWPHNFISYISEVPFRPIARIVVKASRECRQQYKNHHKDGGQTVPLEAVLDGGKLSWGFDPELPAANNRRFKGPVAMLIGPGTSDFGNNLANTIGQYKLAELIGKKTAESPDNYQTPCEVHLPHSHIVIQVPNTLLEGDESLRDNRHGVIPDIVVPASMEPAAGDDPDIAAARRWLFDQLGDL